ncbi:MAG: hypothetical protein A2W91_16235 [Bacteroidetes bacterium GWF2_38_335]|nr:MAG: hypothetical protein A2W91_16235 [Bacteroidetes bacterium GWF2_38_335]OFY81238.1 MAG: hypothetical protein A2281_07210 [Bacteroidetes bacterium RIFOXYA12_FULL_38_20]HBS85355.1 hypothetical protein [Bacteroidales bacterium]
MGFKDILDLPERKQGSKKKNEKNNFLLFAAFFVVGVSFLIKSSRPEMFTLLVSLSGVLFILYQVFNFIAWDNKKQSHYLLFIGNVGLTAGLVIKILDLAYSTGIIFGSIGIIFLSFVISFILNSNK